MRRAMVRSAKLRGFLKVACSIALVASCTPLPARMTPNQLEGTVSADAYGNVAITIGGRIFRLIPLDGKALGELTLQAGGKFYPVRNAGFQLPESALRDVKDRSRGFFRVFVQGYVPRQVWIGQAIDEIALVPTQVLLTVPAFSLRGGILAAPDASVALTIPPNMLTKAETNVALSTYTPDPKAVDPKESGARRNEFLDKVNKRASQGPKAYVLQAVEDCPNADDPLPCPPNTEGMGLMLTVDGPLQPGTLTASLDLGILMRGWNGVGQAPWVANPADWTADQAAHARAADRILRTFARIDAHPLRAAFLDLLREEYGLSLNNRQLTFSVQVGLNNTVDGIVRTDITGVGLLGAQLEFTAISSTQGGLPPVASTPGLIALAGAGAPVVLPISPLLINNGTSLLGQDAASIVAGGGGNLLGQDAASIVAGGGGNIVAGGGGNLISQDAASLIGNDGGSIVGTVRAPLIGQDGAGLIGQDGAGLIGKYRLSTFVDQLWPGRAFVFGSSQGGVPQTVVTDSLGNYRLDSLPPSGPCVVVIAVVGTQRLFTIVTSPRDTEVTANIDAATTAIASWVLDRLATGENTLDELDFAGLELDVIAARQLMTQGDAEAMVHQTMEANADMLEDIFERNVTAFHALPVTVTLFGLAEVQTLAGGPPPTPNFGLFNGKKGLALFKQPHDVYIESNDKIYVSDSQNSVIRRIKKNGDVLTFASGLDHPKGLVKERGYIYVVEQGKNRISKVSASGSVTVFAGASDGAAGTADGPGGIARFNHPEGLAVDAQGVFYVTEDLSPHRVRKILPDGTVSTLAGGSTTGTADGLGTFARFNDPQGVAINAAGNIFISDFGNHTIRMVTPAGEVSTFAGTAGTAGTQDGLASIARFNNPRGLAFDNNDTLWVADSGNHCIRKITAAGDVSTFAGYAGSAAYANGTGSLVRFNTPYGVAMKKDGKDLLVADRDNHCIRIVHIRNESGED